MDKQDQKNNKSGKWIGAAIALFIFAPQLAAIIGVFAGIFYLLRRAAKKNAGESQTVFELPKFEQPKFEQPKFEQTSFGKAERSNFDDCPQSKFCFHKDKGEHHVVRGREIDPWDRPDIDISKYQRKR